MRIFLAGIMQGSHLGAVLHQQDYRSQLRSLLARHFPQADIYDPLADHSDSLDYAFVPEASMGTAIEMWEAYRHGRRVVTISPLAHNWAVRYCSDAIYADFESFAAALAEGEARHWLTRPRPALVP